MAKKDDSKGKKGSVKDTLTNVAKNVVVELFGSQKSGFIPERAAYDELASATSAYVASGQVEAIENFLTDNGPTRRLAMAYLSKPWMEITQQILKDRRFAVAIADLYRKLNDDTVGNYQIIADWMKEARRQLAVALNVRGDLQALLEEQESKPPFPEYDADKTQEQEAGYEVGASVAVELVRRLQGPTTKEEAEGFLNQLIRVVALADGVSAVQGFGDKLTAFMTHKPTESGAQRDGRKLAIDLLKMIPQWQGEYGAQYAAFSALQNNPDFPDPEDAFRPGPQSQKIRHYFDAIYQAPEQVRAGFFAIVSDFLGQALTDSTAHGAEYYEENEKAGAYSVGDDNG